MNSTTFSTFSKAIIQQHEADIITFIRDKNLPEPLNNACLYAMTGGGKRVRPLLVASTYYSLIPYQPSDFQASSSQANNFQAKTTQPPKYTHMRLAMLAVELLHGYSLVHDDLPCMDNDDLRRGKPTTHVKFGEACALLTGDVLQTLAFETLCDPVISQNHKLGGALLASFAPRARRMVMGQMLDLNGENKQLSQTELKAIHQDKTGALIEAAVLMGGICANANHAQLHALEVFAKNIGLAFQVQDDILDVTANTAQLGKPAHSDEKLDKSTYVKLLGVTDAKNYAQCLFDNAKNTLIDEFGNNHYLIDLVNWLWQRNH
ncbi:polyprenyl synthetase [Moraxella macacae 0408225]|uniref:Polyprenyl synthetase n=1 Tax=Moraxella macacae 0408225 TaxID=1230338 RepID=L2F7T4_9GAMM|nr:polyprenyl synthetase family protein [Moraxella macacae]ELA08975.1 polyprenyl synthetase [Moraxella macacae 0408225]